MNIVQITPGAGKMFCGGCFRDNALVAALREQGHEALMVPLYLPLTLDEPDQTTGVPIFYGGINVFLEQQSSFFRTSPKWLHRLLDSPFLLKLAAGSAARTRPEHAGELTLSMLRGELGAQARELDELVNWLKQTAKPDVICLSNGLLVGMAKRLRSELNAPVVCMLQGEDWFLDALPRESREPGWQTLHDRSKDIALFVAPSQFYASHMEKRIGLATGSIRVVPNGINLAGWSAAERVPDPPVLGYFSRLSQIKGLDMVVDAYILLRKRNRVPGLRLKAGGGMSPADAKFVAGLRNRLAKAGLLNEAEFHPNLDREHKVDFFKSLTVMSAPASYGEAFGLYVIESLAAGVPVVQPRLAAFPELIEATKGGLIVEPGNAAALAEGIEQVLLDKGLRNRLSDSGRAAVNEHYSHHAMTRRMVGVFTEVARNQV